MKLTKVDLSFQSCNSNYPESEVVIFSVPMDTTTSFRPGTRFAGNAIRVNSIGIEWYSPYQDKSLKDYHTCDLGDLDIGVGNIKLALDCVYRTTKKILNDQKKPLMIGGEHLVSYSTIKALYEKYPDLRVIHLDAHTDLRVDFLGNIWSHATFMRHVHQFLGDGRIYQFGIRSGDKEEFEWAQTHVIQQKYEISNLSKVVEEIKNHPVYVTIDLDVLDPAYFPGTGTPEPGGITYKELLGALTEFGKLDNFVGADIVELAPMLDSSGSSTMVAIKTLRELVLLLHK
ncbi:MAG: agmatinase [Acholeplasmatales bacterium]|jgi:agmatinase|nr:agmatinase [Acholeplasmatales bacterium]